MRLAWPLSFHTGHVTCKFCCTSLNERLSGNVEQLEFVFPGSRLCQYSGAFEVLKVVKVEKVGLVGNHSPPSDTPKIRLLFCGFH